MSGVQSICHPFATVFFKIITEQRKGSEHAEQSADSLPIFWGLSSFLCKFKKFFGEGKLPVFIPELFRKLIR